MENLIPGFQLRTLLGSEDEEVGKNLDYMILFLTKLRNGEQVDREDIVA